MKKKSSDKAENGKESGEYETEIISSASETTGNKSENADPEQSHSKSEKIDNKDFEAEEKAEPVPVASEDIVTDEKTEAVLSEADAETFEDEKTAVVPITAENDAETVNEKTEIIHTAAETEENSEKIDNAIQKSELQKLVEKEIEEKPKTEKEHKFRLRIKNFWSKKPVKIVSFSLLGVLVLFAGTVVFFNFNALPGTYAFGENVTAKSHDAIESIAQSKLENTVFELKYGDSTVKCNASELGVDFNYDSLANQVLQTGRDENIFLQLWPFKHEDASLTPDYKLKKMESYFEKEYKDTVDKPVDATVTFDSSANEFVVTDGKKGEEINCEKVAAAITDAINENETGTITIKCVSEKVDPIITSKIAAEAKDKANNFVKNSSSLTKNSETVTVISASDYAQFIDFKSDSDNAKINVKVNKDKFTSFFNDNLLKRINIDPVDRTYITNRSGSVTGTLTDGHPGYRLNDKNELLNQLYNSFKNLEATNVEINATVTDCKTSYVQRYVYISLGSFTLSLVENGKVINSFPIYSGREDSVTPTGVYSVYLKYQSQTMRGTGNDGVPYVSPDVPWVSYFNGGIAFHGTPYLQYLGKKNVSHGCINMAPYAAKIAYDFAPVGTEVDVVN